LRAQALHDLAHSGEAAPRRHVGDRGRAERGEVAEDDRVERRGRRERTAEPCLGRRVHHLGELAPDTARRHLHAGEVAPARVRKRAGVTAWETLLERRAQLRSREWALGVQVARMREHRPQVDAAEGRRKLGMPRDLGVEHRLHQRPELEAVVGAQQVERRSHRCDPHCLPLLDQRCELVGPEPLEPRPQSRVRVERHLRLQADEVLDRVERRQRVASQQELALERGSVERATAENVSGQAVPKRTAARAFRFAASTSRSRAGADVTSASSRRSVAAVTSATARSKASWLACDGAFMPLTLRTYCSAAASISSRVVGGSKL
jgi:hypothetical protein